MKKEIFTSILVLSLGCPLKSQNVQPLPKLVVAITIDQLRSDYLEAFASFYGEKGFKRFMTQGKYYTLAEYSFEGNDRASAMATLFTGSTPSVNGIVAENWLDATTFQVKNCVEDARFMGNFTSEYSSPLALETSTIADELKIATDNAGLVYAIAPFRDAAIFSAGHVADGSFWINTYTGKWCSTTYYKDFPAWLTQYNQQYSPDFKINNYIWTPYHPIATYNRLQNKATSPFKYDLNEDKTNRYRRLVNSPFVNEEVNQLCSTLIDKTNLGKDDTTDLLSLTYYGGYYSQSENLTSKTEIQDVYTRLDKTLAQLLEILDKKIGLNHVFLCLTSTGYSNKSSADDKKYQIPGGEFYLNRCSTLLNMYLMAQYGQGQYIEGYHNLQIYLNHKLIEDKQLNYADIQEKSAQFLIQFSGVNKVYTENRLILGAWSPETERIRNGFHRKRSGDLLLEVLPGWTIIQENGTKDYVKRMDRIPFPIIFLAPSIKPEIIHQPVAAERIAPTLSSVMHIRAPNACNVFPLVF